MVSDELPLVHIDQLRLGTFVSLDLGWLEHPFLVNSFVIKTEKQLATLRELGLHMVAYDPLRSQNQPLPLELEPQAPKMPLITPENQRLIDEKRVYDLNFPEGPPVPEQKNSTLSHRFWDLIGLEK